MAACAPTGPSGAVPAAFWGMHVAFAVGHGFPDAPVSAVNLTTSQVYWNQVEVAPGQYDFSRLDGIVSTAEDRGARPLLVLGFTPSFHAKDPTSPTARTTMPDEAAWRSWVTAVVKRYGDRVDYEVWPEPNIVGNWAGTPEEMGRLTVLAGDLIHDEEPDALVVAPAMALRLGEQQQWMDRFWATEVAGAPVGDSVDAVAVDPFPLEEGTPEDALALLCRAQSILDEHEVAAPLWTNEINYGVPSGGGATDVQPYPDEQQAAVVARTYLLHAAMDVDRVYWLGWGSYPGMAVEMSRAGATTPAGRAFSTVHDWLAGAPRPQCLVKADVHTCVVKRKDEVLRISWRERGTATVRVAEGAARIETVSGERRTVEAGGLVRVGQAPVAIIESDRS